MVKLIRMQWAPMEGNETLVKGVGVQVVMKANQSAHLECQRHAYNIIIQPGS